jgi:pyruvate kinase
MADPKATKMTGDGAGVNSWNVIEVAMEDLSEKDRKDLKLELQHEMEEVMAEWQRKKLARF